ncbi:MAG: ORF6N domain-containing protein [Bacteriovoracaceae bacterium]|jgi:hypothetical protein|nr:ORF6N domain-containing protein [Bacteriovoracaceae bacterium]|tara:strand:- start:326 stop:850 length:525 start_codon:yes stop_codon:yes gene_type:complete
MDIQIDQIQNMIYVIRGQKVMLDSDLAQLYGVETKVLNQAVKRNIKRFPADFLLECTIEELEVLRSQFVTSNRGSDWNYKRRTLPMMFTENGVAMLSGILNSDRAINVNIAIMRIFTKLRSFLMLEKDNSKKIDSIEKGTNQLFKVVFERLDNLEEKLPTHNGDRRKIGLKSNK